MRIAILTFNNTHNFGAELQSYALQQFLIGMGHEALHVCTSSYHRGNSIKSKIKAFLSKESDRRYDEFISNRLKFYPGKYDEGSIFELNDKFDAFLSGSDQVWNVANGVNPIFFQQSVPDDKLKLSYAASVGISAIPEMYADEVSRSLSRFDAISVRESDAVKLLCNYTDKDISQNIDPVFLLPAEKWDEVAGERIEKKPYIFVYGTQMTDEIKQVAYKIQKETGYQIISVFRMLKAKSVDEKIGPEEFVNYVKYADYVVTTSFHCTAFSIIYHKNLVEVLHSTTGSRAKNLLESFNQTDSIYSDGFNLNKTWDYSETDALIEHFREESQSYLSAALNVNADSECGGVTEIS